MSEGVALRLVLAVSFVIGLTSTGLVTGESVYFTEDKTPPSVSILSPKDNETYSTDDVLLNFSVTKPDTWYTWEPYFPNQTMKGTLHSIGYQLDGMLYGPIIVDDSLISPFNYSVELEKLEDGVHALLVIVNGTSLGGDYAHALFYDVPINGSSGVVYFTVDTTHANGAPELFPALLIAAVSTVAIAAGAGLLLYRRKRRKEAART